MKRYIFLLYLIFIYNFLCAQKHSEYVTYITYKYKCSYCSKSKFENKIDLQNIKDADILHSASTDSWINAMIGGNNPDDPLCDISRTGRHNYVLADTKRERKLITVDKSEIAKNKQKVEAGYTVGNKADYDKEQEGEGYYNGRKRVARSIWHFGSTEYVWGYIDQAGILRIPFKYSFATRFQEGLAAVSVKDGNGKVGFIDIDGKVVIDFKYDEVTFSNDGKITGYINNVSYKIVNPIFEKEKKEREEKYELELKKKELGKADKCRLFIQTQKKVVSEKKEARKRELERQVGNSNNNASSTNNSNLKTTKYNEIKLGNQIWMQNNLSKKTFNNGDRIKESKSKEEWELACLNQQPTFCYYNYDQNNEAEYGLYYNYYALIDKRGLAPTGWHIPNKNEFIGLSGFLEEDLLLVKMIKKDVWKKRINLFDNNRDKESEEKYYKRYSSDINSSKFSAVLAGRKTKTGFYGKNYEEFWWTNDGISYGISFQDFRQDDWYVGLKGSLIEYEVDAWRSDSDLLYCNVFTEVDALAGYVNGYTVRCIKDE